MAAEAIESQKGGGGVKRALRTLVPRRILQERGVVHRLGKPAAGHYLGLRLMDTLGFRGSNKRTISSPCRRIVFVCFGNIMRSPMAELLLKRSLAECGISGVAVTSAGIHASPGNDAHPWAREAARDLGVSLEPHRSQLLTAEMVAEADAIFAMDFQNKAELLAQYPECREKICLLGAYADGQRKYREIADPYHGDLEETRRCYALLQTCVRNLTRSLAAQAGSDALQSAGRC